jgi:hypothetical protein
MDINLVNKVISDFPNKSILSDGIFTLGELHKDRLSLYINLIDLLTVIYEAKGVRDIMWISTKDHLGNSTDGYIHLGLFPKDKNLLMGAKVPQELWDLYDNKAQILMEAPNYKSLVDTLPNYFYEKLNKSE